MGYYFSLFVCRCNGPKIILFVIDYSSGPHCVKVGLIIHIFYLFNLL